MSCNRAVFYMMSRYFSLIVSLGICYCSITGVAVALPPLGLTLIDSTSFSFTDGLSIDLSVIDESAYVSTSSGVWQVSPTTLNSFIPIVHSQFGQPSGLNSVTQVVEAFDGQLYVAAVFLQPTNRPAGALFKLTSPSEEIATWLTSQTLVGVDRNLRTLGDERGQFAAQYSIDGSVTPLDAYCNPAGCSTSLNFLSNSTEQGFAVGTVDIPGTLGSGIAVWDPNGAVTLVQGFDVPGRISDRLDGNGYNITLGDTGFRLGNTTYLPMPLTEEHVISQSDFVVLQSSRFSQKSFGFYPGILPGSPSEGVPLIEIFPELATINYLAVSDVYAVGHRIYMTLYGEDGLFLFGTVDPSNVPEPSSLVLAIGFICLMPMRRRIKESSSSC